MQHSKKYIECNYISDACFWKITSANNRPFKDEKVLIENGFDYIPAVIDDESDAYIILEQLIKKKNPSDFNDLMEVLFESVQEYFGNYSKKLDDTETEGDIGKVSNLKGMNATMCVERAMLSQNLLCYLGIDSIYKCSSINKNDKIGVHPYNLIKHDDKFYIFDATIPTVKNNLINPLIGNIPLYVFDKMASGYERDGYSILVSYYNDFQSEETNIIYDAGRKNIYQANEGMETI